MGGYAEWVCCREVGKSQLERRGKFRLHGIVRSVRTNQLKINLQAQENPCFLAKHYSVCSWFYVSETPLSSHCRVSVPPELPSEPLQQSSRKLQLECSAAHWHCCTTTGSRTWPSNISQHSMVSMVHHRNQANQNQGINSDAKRPNRRRLPHRCIVIPVLVPLDSGSFPTRCRRGNQK